MSTVAIKHVLLLLFFVVVVVVVIVFLLFVHICGSKFLPQHAQLVFLQYVSNLICLLLFYVLTGRRLADGNKGERSEGCFPTELYKAALNFDRNSLESKCIFSSTDGAPAVTVAISHMFAPCRYLPRIDRNICKINISVLYWRYQSEYIMFSFNILDFLP